MPDTHPIPIAIRPDLSDEQVVERVRGGDAALFEILMRRHNQRLYRVVRSVLRDEAGIEDVMQQAYVEAFTHLDQFAGRARFSTWLCRIGWNEARRRVRGATRLRAVGDETELDAALVAGGPDAMNDPEADLSRGQLAGLLESAIDGLPEIYRVVFVLREVEELSTADTADCLSLSEEAVKVRLHRARGLLREALYARIGAEATEAFRFGNARCDRVVAGTFERLALQRAK
jgi:RNA polymerase sigma-70 factor (ECF subfamily)